MERTDLLKPLNDLAYILECAALDYHGELKSVLSVLCKKIQEHEPQYESREVLTALPQLEKALENYCSGRKEAGALALSAVSRTWWAAVLCIP